MSSAEKSPKGFYVYFLIDERSREIFYVGKGKGARMFQHVRNYHNGHVDNPFKQQRIHEIIKSGGVVITQVYKDDLTEKEAFKIEREFIDSLPNLTNIQKGITTREEKSILAAKLSLDRMLKPCEFLCLHDPAEDWCGDSRLSWYTKIHNEYRKLAYKPRPKPKPLPKRFRVSKGKIVSQWEWVNPNNDRIKSLLSDRGLSNIVNIV